MITDLIKIGDLDSSFGLPPPVNPVAWSFALKIDFLLLGFYWHDVVHGTLSVNTIFPNDVFF